MGPNIINELNLSYSKSTNTTKWDAKYGILIYQLSLNMPFHLKFNIRIYYLEFSMKRSRKSHHLVALFYFK